MEKRKYFAKYDGPPSSWGVYWKSKADFGQLYVVATFYHVPGVKSKEEAKKYADKLNKISK